LGSPNNGGVEAIKSHPFFKDIEWDKVLSKTYKPPIKPKVKGEGDTKNIDKKFLNEKILDTQPNKIESIAVEKMHFENFTFIGDSSLR
jgi:serum/glucocorticoid-regulated kinase 2